MRRPVRISSLAAATPAMRASRCVPPAPGMIPSRTSVRPISALSAAIRMSQANASSNPPPNATPFTAAMVGRGNAASASMSALISPRKTRVSSSVQVRRSFRSAPAENALSPAPLTTSARTSAPAAISCARSPSVLVISATSARDSAFAAAGRLSVTNTARSRRSTSRGAAAPPSAISITTTLPDSSQTIFASPDRRIRRSLVMSAASSTRSATLRAHFGGRRSNRRALISQRPAPVRTISAAACMPSHWICSVAGRPRKGRSSA